MTKQAVSAQAMRSLRTSVCQGLAAVLQQGLSLNEVLAQLPASIRPQDKAVIQAGLYGVLRYYPSLLRQIQQRLKTPFKSKDKQLEYLLCFALFQLVYQKKPAHAIVHETVSAVTALGKPWAKAVVNAVLRKVTDDSELTLKTTSAQQDFNHPDWWQKALSQAWPDDWQNLLHANQQQAPLVLRVNTRKITVADYLIKLAAVGKTAKPHAIASSAIVLDEACPVHELPGFAQGDIAVQDASAQMVAPLLELTQGMRVLDACAAPGGKTSHLLHEADNLHVTALEISEVRAKRLHDNLKRMGQKALIVIGDAADPNVWWDHQPFDRILADVPCSASGIIRRHPDIKYLRRETDLAQLPKQQLAILTALWTLLKPGGILIYSTCSVFPQENDAVIAAWLSQTPDVNIIDLPEILGVKTTYGRQRLSGQYNMDGFYYAKFAKLPIHDH